MLYCNHVDQRSRRGSKFAHPRRYTCVLNPFLDYRASKCPSCLRQTFERKFALFIHIEGTGPIILGKTCKYCARCEMIFVNQPDVAAELGLVTGRPVEELDWMVLGTVDKRYWKARLGQGPATADTPAILVPFKDTRRVACG